MKKMILLVAALALTAAASAQPIRLGLKAGMSMHSTDIGAAQAVWQGQPNAWSDFASKDIGWHAGLMARINLPLTGLYVQPELLYNHTSYELARDAGGTEKLTHGTIELPVLLGFKVLMLNANVGPTFTLANITGGDIYTIESPSVGWQAGLGVTLKDLAIDVRYQGYFEKRWKEIGAGDVVDQLKANGGYWNVSLGYFF